MLPLLIRRLGYTPDKCVMLDDCVSVWRFVLVLKPSVFPSFSNACVIIFVV